MLVAAGNHDHALMGKTGGLRGQGRLIGIVIMVMAVVLASFVHPIVASAATGGAQFVSGSGTLVDTRYGPGDKTPLTANTWRSVQIAGVAGVPTTSVTAVSVMAVVASSASAGTFSVRPTGNTASSSELPVMSYTADSYSHTSNSAIVTLGTDGKLDIKATTPTDVVLFLEGYYTTAGGTTAGGFVPTAPTVVAQSTSTLQPGSTTKFQITGDVVPATAKAVFLNISTKHRSSTGGDWSIYSADGSANVTSFNVPNPENTLTSNGAIVALGASGAVNLRLRGAAMDVTIRVEGYFTGGSASGSFTPANGVLLKQTAAVNGNLTLPVAGHAGIPLTTAGLTSVVLHVDSLPVPNDTTVGSYNGKTSYVNVKADGTATWDRALDTTIGTARSNTVTVAVGLDGAIAIQNSNYGHSLLKVSVEGWYVGPSTTLCKHDDVAITNLASDGADRGVPTLSAGITNGLGQPINVSLYIQDSKGNPVGGATAAAGVVDSGTAAIFHPNGLSAGAQYTWWMYGSVADTCASQATSAKQTFTMGQASDTALAAQTLTLPSSALSIRSGRVGGAFGDGELKAGSDGTSTWVSTMKANLSAVPVGARIIRATLHTDAAQCLGDGNCTAQVASLSSSATDVTAFMSPDDAVAAATPDSGAAVGSDGGDFDVTGLVQSWYGGGSATNTGAVFTATVTDAGGNSDEAPAGLAFKGGSTLQLSYAAAAAPSAPTQLRVTAGDGGILSSWVAPADTGYLDQSGATDGVSGYEVTARPAAGGTAVATMSTSGTSAVLHGLTNGTKYQVTVTARNPIGSGPSSSITGTPVAVPGGPSTYVQAVANLVDAQTQLETGASDSTDDAAQGDDAVQDALAVTAGNLIDDSEAAHLQKITKTGAVSNVSEPLVAYDANTKLASVFATISDSATTTDTSDPNTPVTLQTGSNEQIAFQLTTGAKPTFTGSGDASALAFPVSPTAADTLEVPGSSSGTADQPPAAPLVIDTQTGEITATSTTTSIALATPRIAAAQAKVNVNYSNIASWANSNATSTFYNGYTDDCTDFAARAMYYGGGMQMRYPSGVLPHSDTNTHHWYHGGNAAYPRYSTSWGVAKDSLAWLTYQGSAVSHSRAGMGVGDIVYVNWKGDSSGKHIDHAGVIVKVTSGNVYIAQHSAARVDTLEAQKNYHAWRTGNPKMYLWVTRPVETK